VRRPSLPAQLIVGVLVSVVCLWVAFRNVAFGALVESLRGANYWWLAAYPVLGVALNLIRAEIWRVLLDRRARCAETFWAYSVGFLVNNVLPFRLGEAARVAVLAFRRSIPVAEVVAAVALERVLDLVAIVAILTAVLPFVTHAVDIRRAAVWTGATSAAMIVALVLVIVARRRLDPVVAAIAARLPPRYAASLPRRWRELSDGLAVIGKPRLAFAVGGGAALVWMLTIVLQWCVLRAFQPAARLIDAATFVAVVSVGAAVPAAPGSIGTYQWVGQQALSSPFSVRYSPTMALAIAIVSHAASYVFSSALGALGLWYFGVSFGKVRGMTTAAPEYAEGAGLSESLAARGPIVQELTGE
jgi:uncharacterized protein (TIRG00374 family)